LRSQNSKTKTKKEGRMRITVSALSGYDKVWLYEKQCWKFKTIPHYGAGFSIIVLLFQWKVNFTEDKNTLLSKNGHKLELNAKGEGHLGVSFSPNLLK
jgi:hypothetical protein